MNIEIDSRYISLSDWPGYRIGPHDGSLWSCRTLNGKGPYPAPWHRVNGTPNPKGYIFVRLCSGDGSSHTIALHRLMLETFVGLRPPGMECCHADGNPANNALSNLRWDTSRANGQDRVKHGRQQRGEESRISKLNEEQVREIRELRRQGWTYIRIREKFGVAHGTVHAAINGRTWLHVV